jgi:hypothetical protein
VENDAEGAATGGKHQGTEQLKGDLFITRGAGRESLPAQQGHLAGEQMPVVEHTIQTVLWDELIRSE